MDPWDRRGGDRPRDDRPRDDRLRDQRERDQRERDRLERERLEKLRLDAEWAQHVADRVAADAADAAAAERSGAFLAADRDRIVREQQAAGLRDGRLQVWPESGTRLPSAVQLMNPLDLATYGWMDWRHPTVADLHARLLGRFHPDDGGDLALFSPRVPQGMQLIAREHVPTEWTWVSIDRVPYPLAVRADRGLVLLSWQDPALHPALNPGGRS